MQAGNRHLLARTNPIVFIDPSTTICTIQMYEVSETPLISISLEECRDSMGVIGGVISMWYWKYMGVIGGSLYEIWEVVGDPRGS